MSEIGSQVLPDDEFGLGELPATRLRRLEAAHQPLTVPLMVIEDQLDGSDPIADPPGRRAAAADELLELVTERGREALDEPGHELAAFARREPESRVWPDREIDAAADQLAVAVRSRRAVASLGQRDRDRVGVG